MPSKLLCYGVKTNIFVRCTVCNWIYTQGIYTNFIRINNIWDFFVIFLDHLSVISFLIFILLFDTHWHYTVILYIEYVFPPEVHLSHGYSYSLEFWSDGGGTSHLITHNAFKPYLRSRAFFTRYWLFPSAGQKTMKITPPKNCHGRDSYYGPPGLNGSLVYR